MLKVEEAQLKTLANKGGKGGFLLRGDIIEGAISFQDGPSEDAYKEDLCRCRSMLWIKWGKDVTEKT